MPRVVVLLALIFVSLAAGARSEPQATPLSHETLRDLVPRWWQWRTALPELAIPNRDTAGHFCDVGQSGDTWFLAGLLAFGASPSKPIHRTCQIPASKRLFFPIVTIFRITHDAVTCDKAAAEVSAQVDKATDLFAKLDGADLAIPTRNRSASAEHCFPLLLRADGPSADLTAAADGTWLMLGPLPPGHHTLSYGGTFHVSEGEPRPQNTTYEFEVR